MSIVQELNELTRQVRCNSFETLLQSCRLGDMAKEVERWGVEGVPILASLEDILAWEMLEWSIQHNNRPKEVYY